MTRKGSTMKDQIRSVLLENPQATQQDICKALPDLTYEQISGPLSSLRRDLGIPTSRKQKKREKQLKKAEEQGKPAATVIKMQELYPIDTVVNKLFDLIVERVQANSNAASEVIQLKETIKLLEDENTALASKNADLREKVKKLGAYALKFNEQEISKLTKME